MQLVGHCIGLALLVAALPPALVTVVAGRTAWRAVNWVLAWR